MPKMTKAELAKRKGDMTVRARIEVAKTEIVQFRVDADNINKLYQSAAKAKMPIGTMVRQWVLERLAIEETEKHIDLPQEYLDSIASLHLRLDRLEKMFVKDKFKKAVRRSKRA